MIWLVTIIGIDKHKYYYLVLANTGKEAMAIAKQRTVAIVSSMCAEPPSVWMGLNKIKIAMVRPLQYDK